MKCRCHEWYPLRSIDTSIPSYVQLARNHALENRAKCRSHVCSRYSMTRGYDKPHAGTPMSHTCRGIRDVFPTACGAWLYNIPAPRDISGRKRRKVVCASRARNETRAARIRSSAFPVLSRVENGIACARVSNIARADRRCSANIYNRPLYARLIRAIAIINVAV